MRIGILTSIPVGAPGQCLPTLAAVPNVEVCCVILSSESVQDRNGVLRKKIWKTMQIGPLGAFNGIRIRKWWQHSVPVDVRESAAQLGIPVIDVESINSDDVVAAMTEHRLDLVISLGNGYIRSKVFETPRYGMINYHGELLPEYPGALSIVWPIYFGLRKTGFTIHKINRRIDEGAILLRREFDIDFGSTLRETVERTGKAIHPHIPEALAQVVGSWEELSLRALANEPKRSFTTPTIWEFACMSFNNHRLYRQTARVQGEVR
jgi:methionyl-tRNA formyltransferase